MSITSFHISALGLNPTTDRHLVSASVDFDGYVSYDSEIRDGILVRLAATKGWKAAKALKETVQAEFDEIGGRFECADPAVCNAYRLALDDIDRAAQLREED